MPNSQESISQIVSTIISTMMDKVMNKVLIQDPFISDEHRAKKPLYAALVPDEIFKGSHFERRFVTPFGNVWEVLAKSVASAYWGKAEQGVTIQGVIPSERLYRINEILRELEHPEKGSERRKPEWNRELQYIMEGKGELIPVPVVCDLLVTDVRTNNIYSFELKAPLPNSDQTKVSKEKILKLYAMEPRIITDAFFALPYNPYGKRENYAWSFPQRWFNMKSDNAVLIGNEFWDFIGGAGTYESFIAVVNELGLHYRTRIYQEFLGIEPPDIDGLVKL